MTPQRVTLDEIEAERVRRYHARNHLLPFTRYTKPDYQVNWHHRVITKVCNDVVLGLTRDPSLDPKNPPSNNPHCVLNPDAPKRVIICVQPRAGKSEIVSRRLPAYALGRNPNLEIITVSHTADLAASMNRDVQGIIDSPEYHRLFPHTTLNASNVKTVAYGTYLRNSSIFEIVGYKGRYLSAGVGGPIAGRGAKLAIIDDPFKNRQDADSETIRETIWRFYTSTFRTRVEDNGAIIIMHTRWHDDDLVGRLLELERNEPEYADRWEVVSLPSILDVIPDPEQDPKGYESYTKYDQRRELGMVLWPQRYDLRFLKGVQVLNSDDFEAGYQQRPVRPGGQMFPLGAWKLMRFEDFRVFPDMVFVRGWDKGATEGSGSFTSGVLICYDPEYRYGAYFLVLHCARQQYEESSRETLMRNTAHIDQSMYGEVHIVVEQEPGGGGKDSALNTARRTLAGFDVELKVAASRGDKVAHAKPFSAQQKIGNVAIVMSESWDYAGFMQRYSRFPQGKDKDDIDAGSMAFNSAALGWDQEYIITDYYPEIISQY